jgi:hypothetical protein
MKMEEKRCIIEGLEIFLFSVFTVNTKTHSALFLFPKETLSLGHGNHDLGPCLSKTPTKLGQKSRDTT